MENENVDKEIMDLLDFLSEEHLNTKIKDTDSLKLLNILFNLKGRRISEGKVQKVTYPVHKIYEQENEDIQLQCEVLKKCLLINKNMKEQLLQVITYLNSQFEQITIDSNAMKKLPRLLNEIILFCKSEKEERLFQENISVYHLQSFFFHAMQEQNALRIYMLSTVVPNSISLLNEVQQTQMLQDIFSQCKAKHNLDVLCLISNYVDKKMLLINQESLLHSNNFWIYLENCISCDTYSQQKQAIFLLKTWVQVFRNYNSERCDIPYLQINNSHLEKIWQNFFTLLDASKEKQLHLVWPSLTLLDSVKNVDVMWQICAYKKLLSHTQSAVVFYVATHILQENIFLQKLNKSFLSAVNKNEYTDYSTKAFRELPNFCNNLSADDFGLFLADISEITWTPTAAWGVFSNIFSEKMTKTVPFKVIERFYKLLLQLPHVYIRKGCVSICLNYFIRHYDWNKNFDEVSKLLIIIREHDNCLFGKTVSNHVDVNYLSFILHEIKSEVVDVKMFEIYVKIMKISNFERGLQSIAKNIERLDTNFLPVVYSNLYEKCKASDVENFVLEEVTKFNYDFTETFLLIVEKLMKSQRFGDEFYSKMCSILCEPSFYNRDTVFVALRTIVHYRDKREVPKDITKGIRLQYFDGGRTDDDLYVLFLDLYFLTEDPEISFMDDILHTQSDVVVSKLFQCLSSFYFHENHVDIIKFFEQSVNILPQLTKSRHFKKIAFNYINGVFSIKFVQALHDLKMLDVVTLITGSLLSLSETFPIIDYYLSKKIREHVMSSHGLTSTFCGVLIPVIQELLLKGAIVKKDDRVEYCVCQEIYEVLGPAIKKPNFVKTSLRVWSLDSMMYIVRKFPELADAFAVGLIEKYKTYFNKRYFPDSQIHLEKLRIIQALLTIHPLIKNERQPLITLILNSFCTEVHQPCVKQLMQWLLLALLKDQNDDYFTLIKAKIDVTSKTQPSSIVAFVVVLFHLTLRRQESYWSAAVDAFIPYTMGAYFKLRVYSQVAIIKLLEEAKQKNYHNFLTKHNYLEKPMHSVIKATGRAFYDALKSDELIFSVFKPDRDYSLETFYVDIPKLNSVTKTEWENVLHYDFGTSSIHVFNKDRSFSESVIKYSKNDIKQTSEDSLVSVSSIQRKITPLKFPMEGRGSGEISDFILIATLVEKSANLGGLSRTCEVFGVKELILNDVKVLNDKEFRSLSMSSEDLINAVEVKVSDLKTFICNIREKGYTVIGAEQTSDSISLHKYKFDKKTALVLGNEKEGIPSDLIPLLDKCVEIPQFGMVRSLNVHVAGATFVWEYAKQHLVQ